MIALVWFLILCAIRGYSSLPRSFTDIDPEINMNISELIRYNGYPCEEHEVITDDGYILSLQRIPNGKSNVNKIYPNESRKPAVLLQHGLLDSGHTWVNNPPLQSLAYILADEGFDVWITNSRGTTYSRKHKNLDPDSKEFWKFSWDEMAEYDVPAFINYILKVSKNSRLSYVGHSQGSMMAFAKLSSDQNISKFVSSFSALGPVITVKHIGWIPQYSLSTVEILGPLFNLLYHGEFFANNKFIKFIAEHICTKPLITNLCADPIFWLSGFDISNLNMSRVPLIIANTPAGTSIQNMVHFYQGFKTGNFQKYDYGASENMRKYGTKTPPLYNVTALNVPLSLFWGGKDVLADPTDVQYLIPLVEKVLKKEKFVPYYNHMDYVWGIDACKDIYPDLIQFIKQYA